MKTTMKTTYDALRKRALHRGYVLHKSRLMSEYPTIDDHGEYLLVDVETRGAVLGFKYDATLEDVAEYLED